MSSTPPKSVSAPSTPTEQAKQLVPGSVKKRKKKRSGVHFPDILVTCYLDPPNPWPKDTSVTLDSLANAYTLACSKQDVEPLTCVLDQIKEYENHAEKFELESRMFDLSIIGEKLSNKHCEALEGLLNKIKFQLIDLEGCTFEEGGASIVFDMIEYYDSAVHLNISYVRHIDGRGWQSCLKMIKKTNSLLHLNARSTEINEQMLLIMGKAFRFGSNILTLHLENCGIHGRCLVILVPALKLNRTLRELFLAENKISSADGFLLGNLLRTSTHLELLDLSNNNLEDEGLVHLMESLGQQSNTSGRGLSTLILWNNGLTSRGMTYVSKALNSARTLKRFNLGSNAIGDEGLRELKHSFICNQTLEILELENCKITAVGAVDLAEYISASSVIQKMDLRSNDIRFSGVNSLCEAMKDNHSIISLQLDHTSLDINDPVKERLADIQQINQYCSRNKEESKFKPAQDIYLSTLFNGIFSRVLPMSFVNSSGEVTNVGAKISKTGRFQVSPVFLDLNGESHVEKSADERSSSGEIVLNRLENGCPPSMVCDEQCSNPTDAKLNNDTSEFSKTSTEKASPTFKVQYTGKGLDGKWVKDIDLSMMKDTEDGSALNDTDDVFVPKNWNDLPSERRHSDASVLYGNKSKMGAKLKNELTLLIPGKTTVDFSQIDPKERRLSSPSVPTEPHVFRKIHNIKCCKELESLDLCSSIPISPTKLYENFSFPQPSVEDVSSLLSSGAT